MPEGSPSVLIIRLDAIGDALALTPLLAAFRRHAIPVDVVLRPENSGIFSTRAVRNVVTAAFALRSSARPTIAAIEQLARELLQQAYSHVLVATEDPGGYRLAEQIGAPNRLGFVNTRGKPLKRLWARRLLTHAIERTAGLDPSAPHECEVLFKLGSPLLAGERPTRDLDELRPLVLEREPRPEERVAVQITDKWERLGMTVADVVDLVRRVGVYGAPRLLAARSEAPYAQRIAANTGLDVSLFADLNSWKNAIGAATAIVTPDSGALHVAGMIGTPIVAIFPQQRNFALQASRWAPWAAPNRIIQSGDGWPARATEALAQLLAA
jgi:ADP-heptose:LPS heptosyltransferase